jgi:hypothetical protein
MKRSLLAFLAILLPFGLTACPGSEVVIEAALDTADGERQALADLPIRVLPYDRDAIFDSLAAEYPEPEPEIPPEILTMQDEVREAEQEWREAEQEWGRSRERLRELASEMAEMEQQGLRGTPQYQARFREFDQLESRVRATNQTMESAFERFTTMQQQVFGRADSIRAVREAWADRAYADFPEAAEARLQATRRDEVSDTTNASGIARVRARSGSWWVHARYTLPYEELYWNVPIEVDGDQVTVRLSRENAEIRPAM